jgi:hypothetical protein
VQQQQQQEQPYVTAETAGSEWQPEAGQRFLCPEQFGAIVNEYASRLGFTLARSFTYSSMSNSQSITVQKGILYCSILEKPLKYATCPFRIEFSLRVKTMDYVVTKVSTNHCHTLNAASSLQSPTPVITTTTTTATTTTAANARHSALMSRSEKICKLADGCKLQVAHGSFW